MSSLLSSWPGPWAQPASADLPSHAPAEVFAAGERNHHISNTAYPIAHPITWKPYRIPRADMESRMAQAWSNVLDICLYAHIPFCETRCSYCEYTVVARSELGAAAGYVEHLLQELALAQEVLGTESRLLHGFDIGGGTPSLLPAADIEQLLDRVHSVFRFAPGSEVSIETTPKVAAAEAQKMADCYAAGIRRISMGVQVTEPDLLRAFNRSDQGAELHRRAVDHIRRAGFQKFNVDLMYGFADQSLQSWEATLQHAIGLEPDAITLYRMRYKLTRVSHHAPRVSLEGVRAQNQLASQWLKSAGYQAHPGKNTYSKVKGDVGTSHYLQHRVERGMPYWGLGLGAQSLSPSTIAYNDGAAGKNLAPYLRSLSESRLPIQDGYHLPLAHLAAKMIAVSFYFGCIDRAHFLAKFGIPLEAAFPQEIAYAVEQGLMEWTEQHLSLTERGAQHFNGTIALFFAPSVKTYLLERNPDTAADMSRARSQALRVAGFEPLGV